MNSRDQIHALVESWETEGLQPESIHELESGKPVVNAGGFRKLRDELEYLDRIKFERYVPTLYSKHPITFFGRLKAWLNNPYLSDEDKRHLFEFSTHLAFFSFDDFVALFRSAFAGPISRWTMDHANIRIDQVDWMQNLDKERFDRTWYCPVTDSLLISVFHHVNGISGKERKPAFRELFNFSAPVKKIREYLQENGIKRLVLLEDCVGTGDQCFKSVKWAVETLEIPILFCPMIISSEAIQKFETFKTILPDQALFEIKPIFQLDADCFLVRDGGTESKLFKHIRVLAERIQTELSSIGEAPAEGAFGYWHTTSPEKGAMMVLFSNTPNNTVSLVHHASTQWQPLFPRITRSFL